MMQILQACGNVNRFQIGCKGFAGHRKIAPAGVDLHAFARCAFARYLLKRCAYQFFTVVFAYKMITVSAAADLSISP